jgi:hypothetical protein
VRAEKRPADGQAAGRKSSDVGAPGRPQPSSRNRQVAGTAYGRAALASALDRIESSPGGMRHRTVYAASAAVGQVLTGGELRDETPVAAALEAMARNIGLTDNEAARQVRRGIERGATTPRKAPTDGRMLRDAGDARDRLVAWWEAVEAHHLTGRGATTTMRLLAAFGLLAMRAGKMRVSESHRQLAEAAGVNSGTVARHRGRLAPFVRVVERGNRATGKPTTWQLVVVKRVASRTNPEGSPTRISGLVHHATPLGSPAHDLWSRWPSGWRLWTVLDESDAATVAELVAASGCHRSTCYRTLPRLAALGLAVTDGEGRWRGVVPEGIGDSGFVRSRKRERHAAEREAWAGWRRLALDERRRAS